MKEMKNKMCQATKYSEQLLEIYNNINSEVRRLCAEVNTADLYDLDMLHIIEKGGFNACEGYKFAKMIYDSRIKRRKAKNELETLKQLKNNFIDKNMELLNKTHQEVVRRDIILKDLTERKVYNNRVIGRDTTEVVTEVKSNVVVNNIPASVPKVDPMSLTPIHKKTNAKLQVISKIDEDHYVVKKKGCGMQVMLKKNILNLEYFQSAK